MQMLRSAPTYQSLAVRLMFVLQATLSFAYAGEIAQELRCLGMHRSQGIELPSDVQIANPGAVEQFLTLDDAHLTIQNPEAADLEYVRCKTPEAQYSNQCGLTPQRFIVGWKAIGKWLSTPKGQSSRPKALPLSVDHVEISRSSMSIRWTHLTGNVRASKTRGQATQVYFVSSEFTGKCERAQMVL